MAESTKNRPHMSTAPALPGADAERAPYQAPMIILLDVNGRTQTAGGGSVEGASFCSVS